MQEFFQKVVFSGVASDMLLYECVSPESFHTHGVYFMGLFDMVDPCHVEILNLLFKI